MRQKHKFTKTQFLFGWKPYDNNNQLTRDCAKRCDSKARFKRRTLTAVLSWLDCMQHDCSTTWFQNVVLKSNLIQSIEFGTAIARLLKRGLSRLDTLESERDYFIERFRMQTMESCKYDFQDSFQLFHMLISFEVTCSRNKTIWEQEKRIPQMHEWHIQIVQGQFPTIHSIDMFDFTFY